MIKKRILLTSFGSKLAYEFVNDFKTRDLELFIADAQPNSKGRLLTKNFVKVLPGNHKKYSEDLLQKVIDRSIQMVIPGSDEEAYALMVSRELFEDKGIIVAIQEKQFLSQLKSKTEMFSFLEKKGVKVPQYFLVKDQTSFFNALEAMSYPKTPLFIKPDWGRGGMGIHILSETPIADKDNIVCINKSEALKMLENGVAMILMKYIDGIAYDIDVLKYKKGEVFFGTRKRLENVSKFFTGNYFDDNKAVLSFAQDLYKKFPTQYLMDYDLLVEESGEIHLLEINPRPSGSTISYLPFGINLYYILAKSYLDNVDIEVDLKPLYGNHAYCFHKMITTKDGKL